MRVTFFDLGDPEQATGGRSAFIRNVIPWFDDDVRIVGLAHGARSPREWQTRAFGPRTYRFLPVAADRGVTHKPLIPIRLKAMLGVLRLSQATLEDTDVLYVHSAEMALSVLMRRPSVPVVLHMHGATIAPRYSRYRWARLAPIVWTYELAYRAVLRRCDAVITVDSEGMRRCRWILGPQAVERCFLVPTCFDEKVFGASAANEVPREEQAPAQSKQIVFVGRLEEGKGVDMLVRSFVLLAGRRNDVRLVVVGDGTQRTRMEMQVESLGIAGKVEFKGWNDSEAVARLLQFSDVYFLPSQAEGLPIAVLEALACGTPVVATPVGDIASVVADGVNGFLLPSPSAESFGDALARALDHPWDRKAISRSVAALTSSSIASQIANILDAVARASPGRRGGPRCE